MMGTTNSKNNEIEKKNCFGEDQTYYYLNKM